MSEAAAPDMDADRPAESLGEDGGAGWPISRYLLAVALASAVALAALGWARPSLFTSPLMAAGLGHRFAEAPPGSFYAERVAPILESQCAGCHGPRLQRARLRLDTLGDLTLGGKNGRVVAPGDPQASELYTRLLLPKSDRRAMPAGNKPPLPADDIRVIELWIAAGASGATRLGDIADAPPPPAPPVKVDAPDAQAVANARARLAPEVEALQQRYPGTVSYLSRSSEDLAVDAQRLGASFGDEDLANLAALGKAVTRLDLSGTAITDASAPTLARFEALQSLRLIGTATGDATLAGLSGMPALKTLTVIDTHASPESIAELRGRGVRVYDARE